MHHHLALVVGLIVIAVGAVVLVNAYRKLFAKWKILESSSRGSVGSRGFATDFYVAVTAFVAGGGIVAAAVLLPPAPQSSDGDSPIVVRGGSLIIRTGTNWGPLHAPVNGQSEVESELLSGNPTAIAISLTGVGPTGSNNPGDAGPFPISADWQVQLDFRNSNGSADPGDPNQTLFICSRISGSACNLTSTLQNSIYLVGGQYDSTNKSPVFTLEPMDGQTLIKYDITYCRGSSATGPIVPCNHISKVTITDGNGHTWGPYQCVHGMCDISFAEQ